MHRHTRTSRKCVDISILKKEEHVSIHEADSPDTDPRVGIDLAEDTGPVVDTAPVVGILAELVGTGPEAGKPQEDTGPEVGILIALVGTAEQR